MVENGPGWSSSTARMTPVDIRLPTCKSMFNKVYKCTLEQITYIRRLIEIVTYVWKKIYQCNFRYIKMIWSVPNELGNVIIYICYMHADWNYKVWMIPLHVIIVFVALIKDCILFLISVPCTVVKSSKKSYRKEHSCIKEACPARIVFTIIHNCLIYSVLPFRDASGLR